MRFFNVILVLAALASVALSAVPENNIRTTSRTIADVRKIIAANGGCNVNVCFALDGSGSLSANEFELEKNFVLDVVAAIAGNPLEVAAVQYGLRNIAISPLTDDIDQFFLDMDSTPFGRARRTFISGGIVYCQRQLRKVPGEANKIVVLGDGRSNFGGNPVPRADAFRQTGGDVCTVGIGFRDIKMLLAISGGDRKKVLTVDQYLELTDILSDLSLRICGIELE